MTEDEVGPYSVKAGEGKFGVHDESERVIMVCRDEGSAVNYSVLLNEAYRRGYSAGYRWAKGSFRKTQRR